MTKVSEKAALIESEEDRVFRWRYECLLRRGVEDVFAGAVAAGGFDLHRALEMVDEGCSGEALAKIAS